MKKYYNAVMNETNNGEEKYICSKCHRTYMSNNYNLCPYCDNIESNEKEDTLYIFSDCFSYHNGKPDQMSGYCTIITNSKFELEDKYNFECIMREAFEGTTNNYGEVYGVLAGLDYVLNYDNFRNYNTIKVISDSEYTILGAGERMYKWKQNGWKNTSGVVKNLELWKLMYDLVKEIEDMGIEVEFIHQKGHKGKAVTKEENPLIYIQEKSDTFAVSLKNIIISKKGK